jgi:hypothetical protein
LADKTEVAPTVHRWALLPRAALASFDFLLLSPNPTLSSERAVWLWRVIIVGSGMVSPAILLWSVMPIVSPGARDYELVSAGQT